MFTTQITAILYDMDGTLLNTERLKCEAHAQTVLHLRGKSFITDEQYSAFMGQPSEPVARAIMEACTITDCGYRDYRSLWQTYYQNLVESRAKAHDGVHELLKLGRFRRLKQVIVSSSSRISMVRVLEKTRLDTLVDGLVSINDVDNPKPAPDPYRKALQLCFGTRNTAIAVEDTETGLESALAAGLSVIGIRHELNGGHKFKGARRILNVREMADPTRFLGQLLAP